MNQPKLKPPHSHLSQGSDNDPGLLVPKGQFFEICIKGQLPHTWADWFEGFSVEYLDNEEMLLSGYIVDQSALMGVLNKLARLNLTILSLNEINTKNKKEKK